ncbi:retrotransposon protein, putative, ty1-copia subclass [Tanacetum coccineum]
MGRSGIRIRGMLLQDQQHKIKHEEGQSVSSIVLSIEDKLNYLEQPLLPAPVAPEGQLIAPEITTAHTAWIKRLKEIELKTLFAQQADIGKTINELHAMLKLYEQNLPKNNAPALHAIRAGKVQKDMSLEEELSLVLSRVAEEKEHSFRSQWFSSIYTVSKKRAKLDLDSALLWHCRLGPISKKRIEKLQHDGLLNSTDLRALKNASLVCLERWQGNLTHIKWNGPNTYLD